mmetsp:Transcript_24687/g.59415  ORF Transcript_24687/g.59415 Transcript_24687/m.59415 type:complete len:235 (+) Transcript_24687:191-895(+)
MGPQHIHVRIVKDERVIPVLQLQGRQVRVLGEEIRMRVHPAPSDAFRGVPVHVREESEVGREEDVRLPLVDEVRGEVARRPAPRGIADDLLRDDRRVDSTADARRQVAEVRQQQVVRRHAAAEGLEQEEAPGGEERLLGPAERVVPDARQGRVEPLDQRPRRRGGRGGRGGRGHPRARGGPSWPWPWSGTGRDGAVRLGIGLCQLPVLLEEEGGPVEDRVGEGPVGLHVGVGRG